jgi:hypothetical protein
MIKKIVFGAVIVALVAFVAVPSASAACIPGKSAVTFGASATAYWLAASSVGTPVFQAWQLGNPGGFSSTGCPDGALFQDGPPGGMSLNFDLGSCGAGCPGPLNANTLAVLGMNKTPGGTEFLLDTAVENAAALANYDYGAQGNHTMIPIPRPKVLSSARVGSNVNLSVGIDSISAGLFGPNAGTAVTGFNILTASSATNPGTDASAYTLRSTIPSPGGAAATQGVSLDCTNTADQWIVTQIQFESGTVLSKAVSAPTRVHCDQALADPKFKVVPKKLGAPKVTPN